MCPRLGVYPEQASGPRVEEVAGMAFCAHRSAWWASECRRFSGDESFGPWRPGSSEYVRSLLVLSVSRGSERPPERSRCRMAAGGDDDAALASIFKAPPGWFTAIPRTLVRTTPARG